ncbi:hypothetical protein P7H22_11885 [Paenibacillus larvae]|nr:hypothetical protein [Paenibacillus larvae]MDT2240916.1 hypothetical protein [Paenibacillus larvae]
MVTGKTDDVVYVDEPIRLQTMTDSGRVWTQTSLKMIRRWYETGEVEPQH